MNAAVGRRWLWPALLLGVIYLLAGLAFGALASGAPTHRMVVAWRLAAWLASAVAFATHIFYEHAGLRTSPVLTASHVALGVAVGAFGLAAAANVHSYLIGSAPRPLLLVALLAWPALTGTAGFLVAWAAAAVLGRIRRRS